MDGYGVHLHLHRKPPSTPQSSWLMYHVSCVMYGIPRPVSCPRPNRMEWVNRVGDPSSTHLPHSLFAPLDTRHNSPITDTRKETEPESSLQKTPCTDTGIMSTVYSLTFVLAELVVYPIEEDEKIQNQKMTSMYLSVSTRNPHCMILGAASAPHRCV